VEVVKGDSIRPYILIAWSHDGSLKVTVGTTTVRVVCQNTLSMALSSKGFSKVKHTSGMANRLETVAKELLATIEETKRQAAQFRKMAETPLSEDSWRRYVGSVFGWKSEDKGESSGSAIIDAVADQTADHSRLFAKVDALYRTPRGGVEVYQGESGDQWNLWRALNAFTEFASHERGRTADGRQDALYFGEGAKLTESAYSAALDVMAASAAPTIASA
jgi:phage/plasmid-like protein (TIGR03299 family)